jgi:hypothetical protein
MASRRFHAALTSREFPHNFAELGSTLVIGSQFEQNQNQPGQFVGEGAEQSAGVCQAYFMQNVMPIQRGYSSVSFRQMLAGIAGESAIANMTTIRGSGQNVAMHAAVGSNQYVYDPRIGGWLQFPLGTLAIQEHYVAFVKERTFIYFPDYAKVFEYDFDTQDMVEVVIGGLDMTNIKGICAAGAYLVAWSENQVFWSSIFDPTDFVPSLATGAGATSVLAVKGEIVFAASLGDGFVIYTATNAVSARQTGNVQFPFQFREVIGSAGCASRLHVAENANIGAHIVWTASGFQQLNAEQAQYVFADLSDGIIRGVLSELDPTFLRPILQRYQNLDVRLNFASNRWLGVSLRTSSEAALGLPYRIAYVLDTMLERWGRLDVEHRQLLEFSAPEFLAFVSYQQLADEYPSYGDMIGVPYSQFSRRLRIAAPQPNENFGVALTNGAVFRVALSESNQIAPSDEGINFEPPRLYLGKFKVFRTQGAKLQHIRTGGYMNAQVRAHGHGHDGNVIATSGELITHPRQTGTYFGRLNADSFSVEIIGTFALTDLVVECTDAGMRNQRFRDPNSDIAVVELDDGTVVELDNNSVVVVEAP